MPSIFLQFLQISPNSLHLRQNLFPHFLGLLIEASADVVIRLFMEFVHLFVQILDGSRDLLLLAQSITSFNF